VDGTYYNLTGLYNACPIYQQDGGNVQLRLEDTNWTIIDGGYGMWMYYHQVDSEDVCVINESWTWLPMADGSPPAPTVNAGICSTTTTTLAPIIGECGSTQIDDCGNGDLMTCFIGEYYVNDSGILYQCHEAMNLTCYESTDECLITTSTTTTTTTLPNCIGTEIYDCSYYVNETDCLSYFEYDGYYSQCEWDGEYCSLAMPECVYETPVCSGLLDIYGCGSHNESTCTDYYSIMYQCAWDVDTCSSSTYCLLGCEGSIVSNCTDLNQEQCLGGHYMEDGGQYYDCYWEYPDGYPEGCYEMPPFIPCTLVTTTTLPTGYMAEAGNINWTYIAGIISGSAMILGAILVVILAIVPILIVLALVAFVVGLYTTVLGKVEKIL
jgi:hypothetical protein